MPAPSFQDDVGTLRRSLFSALAWAFTCAAVRLPLRALALCAVLGCGRSSRDAQPQARGPTPADSGIVQFDARSAQHAGLAVEAAGAASIDVTIAMPGEIDPDPRKVQEVRPRFAGVVRELRKGVGQPVDRGDVLAIVESKESLTPFPVTSSIAGRVVARPVTPGQSVTPETMLFKVTDLSTVWVELSIDPHQLGRIEIGQPAQVSSQSNARQVQSGVISSVAPASARDTRAARARIVLPNPESRWQPGAFVDVAVTVERAMVPVAVPGDAVVNTAAGAAVFVAEGTRFRRQPVQTGRSDRRYTEIVSGLAAGTPVVTHRADVLQSALEKAGTPE